LTAGSITQTVSGLSNGLYELVVSGHAVQQAGGNPLHTGAFITAGSLSTEVGAGGDYTVSNINVTDGTLAVGYSLVGQIACNWTGFDNFRLYYYGTSIATGLNNASVNRVTNFIRNNKVVSSFNLDVATEVSVSLYNANGMLIESKKIMAQQGKNERVLNATLVSGVYIVKTIIDGKLTVNKIIF
jgi:hypothetical protein